MMSIILSVAIFVIYLIEISWHLYVLSIKRDKFVVDGYAIGSTVITLFLIMFVLGAEWSLRWAYHSNW